MVSHGTSNIGFSSLQNSYGPTISFPLKPTPTYFQKRREERRRGMAALSLNYCFLHKTTPSGLLSKSHGPLHQQRWDNSEFFAIPQRRSSSRRGLWASSAGPSGEDSPSTPRDGEMSLESALKLFGVSEGASFDDILRAKKTILASCKDDQQAIAQVEAAYDMLFMRSFTQRMSGKVVNNSIRYADVKPVKSSRTSTLPQWLQAAVKSPPISVEAPSTNDLGIKTGVYGALMVFTYASGASTDLTGTYGGADVSGLVLAASFGASLYFLTKKGAVVGKATLVTIGGLIVGAVLGTALEQWLQVDIVPFLGIRSPSVIVSEFILFSQFLVSLYLR